MSAHLDRALLSPARILTAATTIACLHGCFEHPKIDLAKLQCDNDHHCPKGAVCDRTSHKCVVPAASDAGPPSIDSGLAWDGFIHEPVGPVDVAAYDVAGELARDSPLRSEAGTDAPMGGGGGPGGMTGSGGVVAGGGGATVTGGAGGATTAPVIDCGPLSNPDNGTVSAPDTTVDGVATYTCGTGYGPSGSSTRKCQPDGTWSGTDPICVPASCPALSEPPGGTVSAPALTYGSIASYACSTGYDLTGVASRKCQSDGTWSDAAPTCVPVDCGPPGSPANGSVEMTTTTFLSTATFTCFSGFVRSGASTVICQSDGRWSDSPPTCTIIDCGPPPDILNGNVTAPSTILGSVASYACMAGYALNGYPSLTCEASGAWSGYPPTCQCQLTMCSGECVDLQTDVNNCGQCGRACIITSPSTVECGEGRCLATLATTSGSRALTVDATDVYWSSSYEVMKVPRSGGQPTILATGTMATDIAVDTTHIYWTDFGNGTVMSLPLGGGALTTIASDQGVPTGIALDGAFVYWASGAVYRAPLAGGTTSPLTTTSTVNAWDIAVYGDDVYWTDVSTVMKADVLTGDLTTLATDQQSPVSIAVDGTSVYWVNRGTGSVSPDGTVMKVARTGGSPFVIAAGQANSSSIALDDTNVYWTTTEDGKIMKAPLDGGPATTLASGRNLPDTIAVDFASVYWTEAGRHVMRLSPK